MTAELYPAPVPRLRRKLSITTVGLGALALFVGVALWIRSDAESAATEHPDVPPVGTPGPAVCPPVWEDGNPVTTRRGNLVPPGAAEALLCAYPFRAPDPMPLGSTYRVSTTVDTVVDLLNRAPETRPPGVECLLGGTTAYNVVLGYPDRQPAVVHVRSCAVDQGGAVRYEVGIGRLTALFGAHR